MRSNRAQSIVCADCRSVERSVGSDWFGSDPGRPEFPPCWWDGGTHELARGTGNLWRTRPGSQPAGQPGSVTASAREAYGQRPADSISVRRVECHQMPSDDHMRKYRQRRRSAGRATLDVDVLDARRDVCPPLSFIISTPMESESGERERRRQRQTVRGEREERETTTDRKKENEWRQIDELRALTHFTVKLIEGNERLCRTHPFARLSHLMDAFRRERASARSTLRRLCHRVPPAPPHTTATQSEREGERAWRGSGLSVASAWLRRNVTWSTE